MNSMQKMIKTKKRLGSQYLTDLNWLIKLTNCFTIGTKYNFYKFIIYLLEKHKN